MRYEVMKSTTIPVECLSGRFGGHASLRPWLRWLSCPGHFCQYGGPVVIEILLAPLFFVNWHRQFVTISMTGEGEVRKIKRLNSIPNRPIFSSR